MSYSATLSTVAHQAPLSMGFPKQEYWMGLTFPPPGELPDPGIEPMSPEAPELQADSLPLSHQGSLVHGSMTHALIVKHSKQCFCFPGGRELKEKFKIDRL